MVSSGYQDDVSRRVHKRHKFHFGRRHIFGQPLVLTLVTGQATASRGSLNTNGSSNQRARNSGKVKTGGTHCNSRRRVNGLSTITETWHPNTYQTRADLSMPFDQAHALSNQRLCSIVISTCSRNEDRHHHHLLVRILYWCNFHSPSLFHSPSFSLVPLQEWFASNKWICYQLLGDFISCTYFCICCICLIHSRAQAPAGVPI
jgi:hypothetical protein